MRILFKFQLTLTVKNNGQLCPLGKGVGNSTNAKEFTNFKLGYIIRKKF